MHRAKIPMLAILSLLLSGMLSIAAAQSTAVESGSGSSEPGVTFYETFMGSSNTLGRVFKLDTNLGYNFNRWFSVDGGLPVFFLNPSSSAPSSAQQSGTGIGNAYVDLNFYLRNPLVNYVSTIQGAAPTGDQSLGLTSGRFTYDWNNHFDRSFHFITPFANAGYASTVSDTSLFVRPFTSYGQVVHLEGGAMARVLHLVSVGGSLYDISPTGTQHLYSRFTPPAYGSFHAQGNPQGRFFTGAHETIGGADLARDNGASVWGSVGLFHTLEAEVGYTRSVRYDLNTLTFGVGFNVGHVLHISP